MIKQYFIQAWAQLRQQPLISAVSIAGTALAIFLIMLVVMMQQVKVVPFAPESNRDRFLHVKWMSISNSNWGDGTSNCPRMFPVVEDTGSRYYLYCFSYIHSCISAGQSGDQCGLATNGRHLLARI